MNETLHYFDFQAAVYDAFQYSCVPKYGEMISVMQRLPAHLYPDRSAHLRVLDLGCGTGNVTAAILDWFPNARVSCLDGAAEMIEMAKQKLSAHNCEFVCADLAGDQWGQRWADDSFDAVVSVLVLEHLPLQAYRNCIAQCRRIMKPGAVMTAVEGYAGQLHQDLYFGEMAQLEQQAVSGNKLPAAQLQEIKKRSSESETHYFTEMHEKRQWWEQAGLARVNFIWQYFCVAALVGFKP